MKWLNPLKYKYLKCYLQYMLVTFIYLHIISTQLLRDKLVESIRAGRSLSAGQIRLCPASHSAAFSPADDLHHWLWLSSRLLEIRPCRAHAVDSVHNDQPNYISMSSSWGNAPSLIVAPFIGHFLPPMSRPDDSPPPKTDGQITRKPGVSRTLTDASLMSSRFLVFDVSPSGGHIAASHQKTLQPNRLHVSY